LPDLINIAEYWIITFISTSHALRADKLMKQINADFIMIPTPREISVSCGLSIKVRSENGPGYRDFLLDNRVSIEKIYEVNKTSDDMINIYPVDSTS